MYKSWCYEKQLTVIVLITLIIHDSDRRLMTSQLTNVLTSEGAEVLCYTDLNGQFHLIDAYFWQNY